MSFPVYATIAILGLGVVTLLTRAFFLLPEREWPLPTWLERGLRYAPLAALVAVVVPEVVMTRGELISSLHDARLYATAVATAYYFWRRGMLGTIVSGTATLLVLRLALGVP